MATRKKPNLKDVLKKQIFYMFPIQEANYWYDEALEELDRYTKPTSEDLEEIIETLVRRAKGQDYDDD